MRRQNEAGNGDGTFFRRAGKRYRPHFRPTGLVGVTRRGMRAAAGGLALALAAGIGLAALPGPR
ncbi:MAG: hypothetical protein LBC97_00960, partial [Bifidobacteriaceae bacterium]|nr:hypothetical protein [Bifidobacteriaceae bacterium]